MPFAGTVGGDLYVVRCGPLDASTSLALAVPQRIVHDTNRYYADLGISPDATRREIREAYQRLDGHESPRLTYVVKQLLNQDVRSRYDETPLGSFFYDYEVETWIRRAHVAEHSRLLEQGESDFGSGPGELLDTPQGRVQYVPTPLVETVEWEWGYFLQNSLCHDRKRLSRWQQLLVSALGHSDLHGENMRLAVGFSQGMESVWGVERVGNQIIVLLDDGEQPTEALARQAASRVVNHQSTQRGHEKHGDNKMSGFRKGAEAAKEATKGGGNFARTQFFGVEDGKTVVVRFLTDADDWIIVDQHQMVPTKRQPDDYPKDAKWPERMGAVCRKDPAFDFGECYICDHLTDGKKVKKPAARTWALACLREEVTEGGKVVGLRDITREVTIPEKDGNPEKTITEKAIVVVNMGYKNFFAVFEGFAGRYGTVLDRDYWIKRSGAGTDTTYQIVPMDPIETETGRFDMREPEFAARYKTDLNLEEVITGRAADDFYARFFDPRFTSDTDGTVTKAEGGAAQPPAPDSDIEEARMEELANRVKGYAGKAEKTEKAPEKEPAPAGAPAGGMRDFS